MTKQIKIMLYALLIAVTLLAIMVAKQNERIDKLQSASMAAWFELDQFRAKLKDVDAKTRPEAIQKAFLEWLERRE